MWGISLIIQPVLLCHTLGLWVSLCSKRGILNEKVRRAQGETCEPDYDSQGTHITDNTETAEGGICLMKCSRSGRGRGECLWIVLLVVTDSQGWDVFLFPDIRVYNAEYGDMGRLGC